MRKELGAAARLSRPALVDTLPKLLDNLAEALEGKNPRSTATETSTIAFEHGGERARLSGFGPEHLMKEYEILRDEICAGLQERIELTERDLSVIHRSIDGAAQ